MRLQQYYKMWSTLYESKDIEHNLDEFIDLKTKIYSKSINKWSFWVDKDQYIVSAIEKPGKNFHVSFTYHDYFDDNETSTITDKQTPLRVLDGVAVAIKELIEDENPNIIEFAVYNIEKKIKVFRRVIKYALKKHSSIFGDYKLKERKVYLKDVPVEIGKIEGIEFTLYK